MWRRSRRRRVFPLPHDPDEQLRIRNRRAAAHVEGSPESSLNEKPMDCNSLKPPSLSGILPDRIYLDKLKTIDPRPSQEEKITYVALPIAIDDSCWRRPASRLPSLRDRRPCPASRLPPLRNHSPPPHRYAVAAPVPPFRPQVPPFRPQVPLRSIASLYGGAFHLQQRQCVATPILVLRRSQCLVLSVPGRLTFDSLLQNQTCMA
ncbi:hypothetical protein GUJ93_ZPchr0006g45218 [Zizania palustris]|uniref:Uncharacterized protein n=1 Tax=Zizania palustris TaxID=103762 RepID=A0A8J5W3X7_ZIZPA|nr:hypothetical protein GUJ93_ZPchr0006g45218 [Zizania palustris]